MREISDSAELTAAEGDTLCAWAAQGLDGRALAVAGPTLATRDRLVIWGAADAAAPLLLEAWAEVGPGYRPLGEAALIDALAGRVKGLARAGQFGWMDYVPPGPAVDRGPPAAGGSGGRCAGSCWPRRSRGTGPPP